MELVVLELQLASALIQVVHGLKLLLLRDLLFAQHVIFEGAESALVLGGVLAFVIMSFTGGAEAFV